VRGCPDGPNDFFLKSAAGLPFLVLKEQFPEEAAMVDPIGNKAGAVADRRIAPVAPAAAVETVKPVANHVASVQSTATVLSGEMAARPPVDSERVARIRKAIEDGRFPIYPTTIADRLLALKLEWSPNDPA
jgi:negative regulator of flagellin synthesis FlgM